MRCVLLTSTSRANKGYRLDFLLLRSTSERCLQLVVELIGALDVRLLVNVSLARLTLVRKLESRLEVHAALSEGR